MIFKKLTLFLLASLASQSIAATSVNLVRAEAQNELAQFPANAAIDKNTGSGNGWALPVEQRRSEQSILFFTDTVLGSPSRQENVVFNLHFAGIRNNRFLMRRFEISWTVDPNPSFTSEFHTVIPDSVSADSGTSLSINGREIILTNSGNAATTYRIESKVSGTQNDLIEQVPPQAITAFRITAKPDPTFVGDASDGNFLLTEFSIEQPDSGKIVLTEGSEGLITARTLTAPVGHELRFSFVQGTAKSPEDFPGQQGGSALTNSSNQATQRVVINEDNLPEGIEYFTIDVLDAAVETRRFYVVIGDNDRPGYLNYVSSHGLFGDSALPGADPNQDGCDNINSYLFRLNPAGQSPPAWRARLPRYTTVTSRAGRFPAITYQIPAPFPHDLKYTIRNGTNLQTWSIAGMRTGYDLGSIWSPDTLISESGTTSEKIVTARSSTPVGGALKQFLKLNLELAATGAE